MDPQQAPQPNQPNQEYQPPQPPTPQQYTAPQTQPQVASGPQYNTVSPGAVTDDYTSNPFLNAVKALVTMLKVNPVASMLCALVLSVIIAVLYVTSMVMAALMAGQPALAVLLGLMSIIAAIIAIVWYLAAQYTVGLASIREERITTKDAFKRASSKLPALAGYAVIHSILLFIGFLLFIVPGLIVLARGSLGYPALLDENLGPIDALKRSFALTKGHVNEMLGAIFAGVFLTGSSYGLLSGAASAAPVIGRYNDLKKLEASHAATPKVHWLNYIAYIVFIPLLVGVLLLFILSFTSNLQENSSQVESSDQFLQQ